MPCDGVTKSVHFVLFELKPQPRWHAMCSSMDAI